MILNPVSVVDSLKNKGLNDMTAFALSESYLNDSDQKSNLNNTLKKTHQKSSKPHDQINSSRMRVKKPNPIQTQSNGDGLHQLNLVTNFGETEMLTPGATV